MDYNKLIRDKIPEIIAKSQKTAYTHIASESEYHPKLREKLQEEVNEFLESNSAEELADILEVLYALAEHQNLSKDQLEQLRQEKEQKRGKFSQRLILDEVI